MGATGGPAVKEFSRIWYMPTAQHWLLSLPSPPSRVRKEHSDAEVAHSLLEQPQGVSSE